VSVARRYVVSEERNRILNMVSEGQISAEEGAKLLDAASPTAFKAPKNAGRAKWFQVRVTDLETGRTKVRVNLPLGLVRLGLKMGGKYAPEVGEVDWDEVLLAIQEGAEGKLVDVEDVDDGEKVEIFVN
jgi:hypothetical protein